MDFIRTVHLLAGMLIGLLLSANGSSASDNKVYVNEIERAQALLAKGDCNAAWNVVWPLAKNGNQQARYFLYQSINGRTIPPGVTKDHASFYRHILVLAAYAALTPREQIPTSGNRDHRFARIDVPASIVALRLGPEGERIAECYRNGPSFKKCLDLGISLGVIPKFAEYARETERQSSETGVAAYCVPSH